MPTATLSSLPRDRDVFSIGASPWATPVENALSLILKELAVWETRLQQSRELITKHVEDNPGAEGIDFRHHRLILAGLIAEGDQIAMSLLGLHEPRATEPLARIDAEISRLMKELAEWHLPADFEDPVPASFKEGMTDIATGRVEDL